LQNSCAKDISRAQLSFSIEVILGECFFVRIFFIVGSGTSLDKLNSLRLIFLFFFRVLSL